MNKRLLASEILSVCLAHRLRVFLWRLPECLPDTARLQAEFLLHFPGPVGIRISSVQQGGPGQHDVFQPSHDLANSIADMMGTCSAIALPVQKGMRAGTARAGCSGQQKIRKYIDIDDIIFNSISKQFPEQFNMASTVGRQPMPAGRERMCRLG